MPQGSGKRAKFRTLCFYKRFDVVLGKKGYEDSRIGGFPASDGTRITAQFTAAPLADLLAFKISCFQNFKNPMRNNVILEQIFMSKIAFISRQEQFCWILEVQIWLGPCQIGFGQTQIGLGQAHIGKGSTYMGMVIFSNPEGPKGPKGPLSPQGPEGARSAHGARSALRRAARRPNRALRARGTKYGTKKYGNDMIRLKQN